MSGGPLWCPSNLACLAPPGSQPDGNPVGPLSFKELQDRLIVTKSTPITLGGRTAKYATVSLQGHYPYDPLKPNQDAYRVCLQMRPEAPQLLARVAVWVRAG